jgi:hypothetical protein
MPGVKPFVPRAPYADRLRARVEALKAACVLLIDDAPRTHVVNHLLDELAVNGVVIVEAVRDAARLLERLYSPRVTPMPSAESIRTGCSRRATPGKPCSGLVSFSRSSMRYSDATSRENGSKSPTARVLDFDADVDA